MPELPEVETVRRVLTQKVVGLTISNVRINDNKIIKQPEINSFSNLIINQKINRVDRLAKHLIFVLDDYVLISHLRMEGKYFYNKKNGPGQLQHIMIVFEFTNGYELRYHDTRQFGTMHLQDINTYFNQLPLSKVGYEPFHQKVTVEYLKQFWSKKTQAIKTCLLDQTVISGIGNIYADEILFQAKIHPCSSPKYLTDNDLQAIIDASRDILQKAVKQGGTTIATYQADIQVHGNFQQLLKVHTKAKQPCILCGNLIEKIKLNGRGTYFCFFCQKVKLKIDL